MFLKRYSRIMILLAFSATLLLGTSLAFAQSGPQGGQQFPVGLNTISYQGRVLVNGQPYEGTGYFKFAIVDSQGKYTWNSDVIVRAQSGEQQIGEPQNPIQISVHQGLFSVRLGATPTMSPISPDAIADPDAVLRVWFSTNGQNFTQLPDRPFSAAPWAIMADTLDGLDSTDFAPWNHDHWGQTWGGSGTGLVLHSDNGLGIQAETESDQDGTAAIMGEASASSGNTFGVVGVTRSGSVGASGVYGVALGDHGTASGVRGETSSDADTSSGITGIAFSPSGIVYGVYGYSNSPDGAGVFGASEGIGVFGESESSVGVRGRSETAMGVEGYSPTGSGVVGGSLSGHGGEFYSSGQYTPTVAITNQNPLGLALDVQGRTVIAADQLPTVYDSILKVTNQSGMGDAIKGEGGDTGVSGVTDKGTGIGVYGAGLSETGTNVGVYGSSASPDGIGVAGNNLRGGFAGYFSGMKAESAALDGHVVVIENMGTGSAGADGLAISMSGESDTPGSNVNFITFFGGSETPVGAIEGNGSGGVVYKSGGADFAELLPASAGLEPGDVVVIGPEGKLMRSTQANQTNVAGVYSTAPGFLGGMNGKMETMEAQGKTGHGDRAPIAIVGIVPVKVSAENGPIRPGDLLTPSNTPGHAMKAKPVNLDGVEFYRPGTIIGKALEPLDKGTGVISVLITLH